MRKRLTQQLVAGVIGDQDIVLLRRPVDPSAITHRSSFGTVRQRPDLEVPLRVLIDKALNGATSCRRSRHLTTGGRGWSFAGPPSRASDRGPLPTVAEAKRSLTYERSWPEAPQATPRRAWLEGRVEDASVDRHECRHYAGWCPTRLLTGDHRLGQRAAVRAGAEPEARIVPGTHDGIDPWSAPKRTCPMAAFWVAGSTSRVLRGSAWLDRTAGAWECRRPGQLDQGRWSGQPSSTGGRHGTHTDRKS